MDDSASETLEFFAPQPGEQEPVKRSFCFIVMAGPDKGATFGLTPGVCTLGRLADCHIVINGRGISRVHATVSIKSCGDVIVEDRDSKNGIFIDGTRVSRALMEAGQTLGLGPEVRLRLELSAGSVQNLLREMYEGATTDSLTGLFTRRGFEERLDVEFAMVQRHQLNACLAVLDLDHFKKVNDQHGHDAGDAVLRSFSAQLKDTVRVGDLACRWGGEEFVLYIRQTPLIGGMTLLERLRRTVMESDVLLPAGNRVRVTFSGGVVDLLEFEDWRTGLRHADEALYRAKGEGRNRVIFYSPSDQG